MKKLILGIIIIIIVSGGLLAHQAKATYINPCQEYGWCNDVTPTPQQCYEDECITPTPTQEITPQATPTAQPAGHGDGLSDNRNDGQGCQSHDCSGNKVVVPSAPPATGRGVDNRSGQPLAPAPFSK